MHGNENDDRIRALMQQRTRIEDEIRRLDSRQAETRRKRELRRKIVAGEAVLAHAAKDAEFASVLYRILDASVGKRDRALFDLDSDLQASFDRASADYRKPRNKPPGPSGRPK